MTTVLDSKLPAKVVAVLAKYGATVTWVVPGEQTQNPASGTVTETGGASYSIKASPPEGVDTRYIDDNLVKIGDQRTTIAGTQSFTPAPGQKVTFGGKTWRVISVQPVRSGDSIAAWEAQLRS